MEIIELNKIDKLDFDFLVTIGMFDGVHKGHQKLISYLVNKAKQNNYLSMVISFEAHPQIILSNNNNAIKLLQTKTQRFNSISRLGVDYLLVLPKEKNILCLSSTEFLDKISQKINIKRVILGYDNRFGNKKDNSFELICQKGVYNNISIERYNNSVATKDINISSTQIRKALENGNIILANQMLGYNYSLLGKVITGKQLGRTIGFNTANISADCQLLPKEGVYITKTIYNNIVYNSITNIGNNPTFDNDKITIETHILDFCQNIYDKNIEIQFIQRLRDERKFDNKEQLTLQIQKDIAYAKNILL